MSARRSQALSSADIDALFAPFVRAKALLIAVSGGPDSTALLVMAAEWAKRRGKTRIEAATVDHGLRPESANEAKAVHVVFNNNNLDYAPRAATRLRKALGQSAIAPSPETPELF